MSAAGGYGVGNQPLDDLSDGRGIAILQHVVNVVATRLADAGVVWLQERGTLDCLDAECWRDIECGLAFVVHLHPNSGGASFGLTSGLVRLPDTLAVDLTGDLPNPLAAGIRQF